ncbi:unnamed protein product [Nesidiocoris tenuis]|uniref:General transcription factor IIH subunit 4 n=1 Tax=Nesidiocoris tenuis TaxID=355587 RepID=A0A6H5HGN2_9HEMI|nr:unnamed protein product [Nesidiocoris tenuis]
MNDDKEAGKAGKSSIKTLQCSNLYEYLKTLSPAVIDRLYTYPIICLAIYRDLPVVAKHYVIRILFVEQPVPQAEANEVTQVLSDLRVWHETSIPGGLPAWELNPVFKKNFKNSLLGGGRTWGIKANLETDSKARDVDYLDKYAMERWECVLHYMVGSKQQEGISVDAVRVLLHAGLMRQDDEDGSPVITKEGFQFLLLDTAEQVWYFMLQYLDTAASRNLDLVNCLAFLFQLSFSTLGKDYCADGMTEEMLTFLQHLREFGLVYQRKRKGGKFYPTRLALNITNRDSSGLAAQRKDGFVVVESNYRIYAYTDSNLQVALIGLFAELLYRFPNMVVGTLTRDSICMALRSGITADQIVNFLRLHAHPRLVAKGPPILPPTITDQINLWEKERDRFGCSDGILYSQFLSHSDFSILRDFAQEHGLLVWQNDQKKNHGRQFWWL